MIKMEIFSIWFAKRKAKEKRDIEFELLQKLQDLNARIDAVPEGNRLANEAKNINLVRSNDQGENQRLYYQKLNSMVSIRRKM